MPESDATSVVPAQVSFVAIYNPLLGPTDETIDHQVVFYTSRSSRLRQAESFAAENDDKESKDEGNEKLRQIGLAQGMVSFARNFSEGKPVDYVETDRSRIVLHELEKDWWILASIDLTRLPIEPASKSTSQADASASPSHQYSSREVCPPQLLIQQLRRAHSTFLLHHDFTLEALYHRVGRLTLCRLLERFWEKFVWNWEILLCGNPVVEIFNGIKLSAGGELGIGVGEEEWGSGEREVLEDFVTRTDGLVDLVVSRFGDAPTEVEDLASPKQTNDIVTQSNDETPWLGLDSHPRPSDGVIFSGVGAISRFSLLQVSQWMEWIYRYGDDAYGVGDDPNSPRRRKHRKRRGRLSRRDVTSPPLISDPFQPARSFSAGIPRPLVTGISPRRGAVDKSSSRASSVSTPARGERGTDWSGFGTETFMKYLTLGYGSSWGFSSETPSTHPRVAALKQEDGSHDGVKQTKSAPEAQEKPDEDVPGNVTDQAKVKNKSLGRFIIGLREDMDTANDQTSETNDPKMDLQATSNGKIALRTLHLRLAFSGDMKHLQAVVYIHQPFIFTFLFELDTPSLTTPSFYQTIRHQLEPLQKPLLTSTSPATASSRISMSENTFDSKTHFSTKSQPEPVYDLVYDPSNLTIRSSIPNIPDLGLPYQPIEPSTSRDFNPPHWSRVESLNVHHRLLSTYIETRSRPLEVERTCKTSRGWWIVWVRISGDLWKEEQNERSKAAIHETDAPPQEAFLIRKASDYASASSHARTGSGTRFFRDLGGASSPGLQAASLSRADMGPGKLAEGLGLDARRYIENLLSLNR